MPRREVRPTEYKTFPAISLKVDAEQGIVEHIITLFGVLDHGNDIAHPGSFAKTISERGGKVRVLDMHKTDSISRILGKPVELQEIGRGELPAQVLEEHPEATGGVKATTQFFIDTPEGKGAFIRAKEDTVEWSYGYDALDFDHSDVKRGDEEISARNLRTVRLWEYGPVLWGMVEGTTTLSAKADAPPDEAKPAPDVTENTIRIRVRDPGDFEDDSFRTITIGEEEDGVQAVIGRLEGETTTTVQSYVFDKDKFDTEEAQAWVDEHKKDMEKQLTEADAEALVPTEQDQGPYQCECLECGHTIESEEHCRDVECPECGGDMRRADRPGPGKADEDDKAVWSTAYINDLPDANFLYIAPDGEKDEDGKTVPRNRRYFPYKDADGDVDLPHLRNAIARIPQSNAPGLTDDKKEQLQERARRLLEEEQEEGEKAVNLSGQVESIRDAFHHQYNTPSGPWDYWVNTIYDEYVIIQHESEAGNQWYQVSYTTTDDSVDFAPRGEWVEGDYVFTPHGEQPEKMRRVLEDFITEANQVLNPEEKVGRVLAQRNASRIAAALTSLIEVLEDAGIDLPGFGEEPPPEEEEKALDVAAEIEWLQLQQKQIELR